MNRIDILLATYNGAAYLPEMIRSLDAQDTDGYRILVRDDGSGDGTLALLHEWRDRRPDHVLILETGVPTGSAAGNFDRLMAASTAPYVLFADQDDYWHPAKVRLTVEALRHAEADPARPAMVFCDLVVVDEARRVLSSSFRRFQRLDIAQGLSLPRLLVQNVVTGCAMGINRAALLLGRDLPASAMMHDWWLALLCAAGGTIVPMSEALIDYRQHSGNVVGAQAYSTKQTLGSFLRGGLRSERQLRFERMYAQLQDQAAALADRLGPDYPVAQQQIAAFRGLAGAGPLTRRARALLGGFHPSGWLRVLGWLFRL